LHKHYQRERNGYTLRKAQKEDAEDYFAQNFCPLDREAARLTGSKEGFTRDEVVSFFLKSIDDSTRAFFLIIAPDGRIIGETVINEIDWDLLSANFRIAIFHPEHRNLGIGSWATACTRDFAFEALKLHRLELEVYAFNPRAQTVYRKAGFQTEGVRREAIKDGGQYSDVILMAMLENDFRKQKETGG